MTARRPWLLLALGFILAWHLWPPGRDAKPDPAGARPPAAERAPRSPTAFAARAQPDAPAAARTGIPACDRLVERSMTCAQLPADARIAIAEASKAWAELTATGPQPGLEASCRATADVQGDALSAMGC